MYRSTALVFALFCTSLVAAAPVTSSTFSEVATQAAAATDIAVTATPLGDILSAVVVNDQSEYAYILPI
jgi:ABC-type Zn uptake system ZnuABC Zn-binding protein ZnuA